MIFSDPWHQGTGFHRDCPGEHTPQDYDKWRHQWKCRRYASHHGSVHGDHPRRIRHPRSTCVRCACLERKNDSILQCQWAGFRGFCLWWRLVFQSNFVVRSESTIVEIFICIYFDLLCSSLLWAYVAIPQSSHLPRTTG